MTTRDVNVIAKEIVAGLVLHKKGDINPETNTKRKNTFYFMTPVEGITAENMNEVVKITTGMVKMTVNGIFKSDAIVKGVSHAVDNTPGQIGHDIRQVMRVGLMHYVQ